jgi:mannose-6-phosphate isomerase-like protein (cupin superfamily)
MMFTSNVEGGADHMPAVDENLFSGPQEGQTFTNPIGGSMTIKASRPGYTLLENVLPAHSPGPRPHIHYRHEETFYVLEGELTLRRGAETIVAPAGASVVIPPGVVHQPANAGSQPTKVLILFAPGGMAEFFMEAAARRIPLQAVTTDPDTLARLADFCAKYSFAFADFPHAD